MKTIKFNKEYYLPILTGEKTQTLRKNKKRIRPGETVRAIFPGTEMQCKLKITKIGYKQFKYINEEDAKLEGFETVEELKKTLMTIYPTLDPLMRVYYYRFKCLD